MFIVINDVPINVFAIKEISDIITIGSSMYEISLKLLNKSYGRDASVFVENWLATNIKENGFDHITPFTKILEYVNEMNKAVLGYEIFEEIGRGMYRFLSPEEIEWNVLPDSYIFAAKFNGDMCGLDYLDDILGSEKFTGTSSKEVCLYSEIYTEMKDIVAARERLIAEIDKLKALSPRIKI